jgi:FAS-associated factor 2
MSDGGGGGGDDGAIARFIEACPGAGADEARFFLEAAGNDADAAVALYRENHHPLAPAPAAQPPPMPMDDDDDDARRPGGGGSGGRDAFAAVRAAEEELVRRTYRQQQQQQRQQDAASGGGGGNAGGNGFLGLALRLPFAVLRTGVTIVASAVGVGLAVAAFLGDRVLPRSVMQACRQLARAARLTADDADPSGQAAEFAAGFAERYLSSSGGSAEAAAAATGEGGQATAASTAPLAATGGSSCPAWVASGWRSSATAAHRDFRLLLAYLHSPRHEDTDAFCRTVLCSQAFADYANAEFLCWGGDVSRSDAFGLALRLGVTRYPAVALLARSGSNVKLAALVQGAGSGDPLALIDSLRTAAEPHAALLAAERADAEGRAAERALVREQDDEYERSLAADRARARERREREEREKREEEERQKREQEEQEERGRREAKRAAEAAAAAAARQAKRASLPEEPAQGSPGSAAVRVRLPTGANHQRRFDAKMATVADVYAWVDALEHAVAEEEAAAATRGGGAAGRDAAADDEAALTARLLALERYVLVQAFPPRREFGRAPGKGGEQTLEEAGLAPQAALFVRLVEEDEDEEAA